MGLIEKIFGRQPKTAPAAESTFQTLTAYSPAFTNWGGQIYESELVRAAVDAKARHIGKLQYRMTGTARPKLWTTTKTAPNAWYTWPQFLERCSNIYEVQNNLFIVPILDDMGEVCGFFPALPSGCELVDRAGEPYLKYSFVGGQKRSVPLRRCAVITKHQLNDDIFGQKNTPLTPTMELVHMVEQGIIEGVKNGATFRFMATLSGKAFDEDLRKERERFDRNNFQGSGGGLLLFGNQFQNVQQLKQEGFHVDADQQKLIQDNICRYFGLGPKILTNEATGDELDAFYNGCIESFAIKLSDSMSRMVFSERERNGGNAITFAGDRLQYMNISAKISMAQQLGDRGILTIDEIRALFNYDPLPNGIGEHVPARGEYYFVDEGKDGGNEDE